MRILIVQNHPDEGAGPFADRFAAAGAALDVRVPARGDVIPAAVGAFDGALVLGGPQNAMDDRRFGYFPALLGLMRAMAAEERPVLGICLGAQLMARAHAAPGNRHPVRPNVRPEIGFDPPVRLHPRSTSDPLFAGEPEILHLMHWHEDVLDLPPAATLLATSRDCPVQAFRIGRTQYGVQFHPEATSTIVRDWIDGDVADLGSDPTGLRDRIERELAAFAPDAEAFGRRFADRFVDLITRTRASRGPVSMEAAA